MIMDTDLDDRDPSVAALHDGTLLLDWFTLDKGRLAGLARPFDRPRTYVGAAQPSWRVQLPLPVCLFLAVCENCPTGR